MNDSYELKEQLRLLQQEANSMQCPDCGGFHQCHIHLSCGDVVVSFERELLGLPCCGYMHFVNQRIRDLKAQYNIPLEP